MRITQQQLHGVSLGSLQHARGRLFALQRQSASGVRVERPSDDPAAAGRARVLSSLMAAQEAYETASSYALARLQTADGALSQASNLLVRARELATAMANDTVSAEQRAAAATEVRQIRAAMIDVANTKYDDAYVFANVATATAPLDASGNFTYDVDTYDEVLEAELGASNRTEIGASGAHAFARRAADPQSVEVVDELELLAQALDANDADAVRAQIDQMDLAHRQVNAERARIGSRIQRVQEAAEAARTQHTLYEELRSDLVDADAVETFSRLQLAETTMQAAVAVAGRVLGPSLVDVL
ncbi:MAG: flagellar hook-associated protein 3 [Deltaproteobacteria bacterium]|nr:MAG: flagellar hook-associated protein 3 [Deltaproteobacteria bacterium]